MKRGRILLQEQRNGDWMFVSKKKGSNPGREKFPMLKCPLCKKNLHIVHNARVKNNAILFDVDDPKYQNVSRDHVCKCARCHRIIGVHFLNVKERRQRGLPLEHECHEKIALA